MYTSKSKYNEKNDNFIFKLIVFYNICIKANVSQKTKLKIFSIMLKNLTLNYYYLNINNKNALITFDEICLTIRFYFENAKYKRKILFK